MSECVLDNKLRHHSQLTACTDNRLDYLDKHADAPSSFWESTTDTGDSGVHQEGDGEGAPGGAAEPKSLKCLDCGKSFRNQALAEYHSSK